jgi:hypothetical protein
MNESPLFVLLAARYRLAAYYDGSNKGRRAYRSRIVLGAALRRYMTRTIIDMGWDTVKASSEKSSWYAAANRYGLEKTFRLGSTYRHKSHFL